MHEVAFLAVPALAAPVYLARAWFARRRARRAGAIDIGQRMSRWGPLSATDGTFWGTKDIPNAKATVFVFMSNRCPGVKAYDARLNALASRYGPEGLRIIGVNSVPTELYPGEALGGMKTAAGERDLRFVYVKDAAHGLQKALGATVTPQAFLVDQTGRLRYRGRIDDAFVASRATSHDLEDAVRAVLEGRDVPRPTTHAIGCSLDHPSSTTRPMRASTPSAYRLEA